MAYQVTNSALTSVRETYTLQNVYPFQNRLLFNSGAYFFFNSLLSNCLDVSLKGGSLFYLTRECLLSEGISSGDQLPPSTELFTPIVYRGQYLTFKYDLSASYNAPTKYPLFFSSKPIIWESFNIKFIDERFCYIVYSDALGDFYLTVDNDVCVMQRRSFFSDVFSPSGAQFFTYALNGTSITLFKKNHTTNTTQQLIVNSLTNELSVVNIQGINGRTLLDYGFGVVENRVYYNTKQNAGFVSYIDNSSRLLIDNETSTFNTPQNYLIYKTAAISQMSSDIISLKSFQTDKNQYTLGNNLALSSKRLNDEIKMRSYTSIFSNIDSDVETGLDLNYIKYNEAITINGTGTTYFKTSQTFEPFKQIRINDTTLAKQGCFAGPVPLLADRIYTLYPTLCTTNSGYISLLCTWLSGGLNNPESIWVDRYYYPDMLQRNSTPGQSTAQNANIINAINTNALLSSVVDSNQYFDVVSNTAFRPNADYAYVRADYSRFNFKPRNDYYKITDKRQYYRTINNNKGFVLAFDVVNYQSLTPYDIFSQISDISGGLRVRFNRDSFYISLRLFSPRTKRYRIIESPVIPMPESRRTRITINVDSLRGILDVYIQHRQVVHRTFTPALYSSILFGKLVTGTGRDVLSLNEQFAASTFRFNNVANVFLSLRPFSESLLHTFVLKYTRNNTEPFSISLPCGMKNEVDSVGVINLLQNSTRSKSNAFNVNIANLNNIDDMHKSNIYNIVANNINEKLPLNTEINKITFV